MSIKIDYNRNHLRVSIECTEPEGLEVNTLGFLTKLEQFLSTLDSFEFVSAHVVSRWAGDSGQKEEPGFGGRTVDTIYVDNFSTGIPEENTPVYPDEFKFTGNKGF